MNGSIIDTPYFYQGTEMSGEGAKKSTRVLADLKGIFTDGKAYEGMDPETLVYRVTSIEPDPLGTVGGLYMGITYLYPGKVGREYFMTKGHFHLNPTSTEFYWGIEGEGMLILMDADRKVWAERMRPGSLHYIRAGIAHRVANTGAGALIFGASWPSDAGHDYAAIARDGFAKRLMEVDGKPQLV